MKPPNTVQTNDCGQTKKQTDAGEQSNKQTVGQTEFATNIDSTYHIIHGIIKIFN